MNKFKKIFWAFFFSFTLFLVLNYISKQFLYEDNSLYTEWRDWLRVGILLVGPIIALVGVVIFLYFLYLLIIRRDKDKYLRVGFKLIIIAILILNFTSSALIGNRFFPDYWTRLNRESNKEKIDENIPAADVQQIREVAKKTSEYPILGIEYYDCAKENAKIEEIEAQGLPNVGPKRSQKCQSGDVLLTVGKIRHCGALCGEGHWNFYLLRKIQNQWQIIEDLGGFGYIS